MQELIERIRAAELKKIKMYSEERMIPASVALRTRPNWPYNN